MIAINQFSIKSKEEKDNKATFTIEPLPNGYGQTLGNILRRLLLSSVPGAAITAVKIDGVTHEYDSLAGVSDDVLTVILSLKKVIVNSKTEDSVTLDIDVKGKTGVTEVKASDISKDSNVEIVNKDYVITKLTAKEAFKAQVVVEKGVGYALPNEEIRKELGMIPVDASFSPVELVNFEVNPTRVGKDTELDSLEITVKTNGAISPEDAMHITANILNEMAAHLKNSMGKVIKGDEPKLISTQIVNEEELDAGGNDNQLLVANMGLTVRLTNALMRSGFDDLRKLEGMTEEEVANIRGMGAKSFNELKEIVEKYGIELI